MLEHLQNCGKQSGTISTNFTYPPAWNLCCCQSWEKWISHLRKWLLRLRQQMHLKIILRHCAGSKLSFSFRGALEATLLKSNLNRHLISYQPHTFLPEFCLKLYLSIENSVVVEPGWCIFLMKLAWEFCSLRQWKRNLYTGRIRHTDILWPNPDTEQWIKPIIDAGAQKYGGTYKRMFHKDAGI